MLLFLLAASAYAAVVDKINAPQGWQVIGRPLGTEVMDFRIAMTTQDIEGTLLQVSDPGHARYGQHLDQHRLAEFLKPHEDASKAVVGWLSSSGIEHNDEGEWIRFKASISQAEDLLQTKFSIWQTGTQAETQAIRTLQYTIPDKLHGIIDMIQPTTSFPTMRRQLQTEPAIDNFGHNLTACNSTITPACLKRLYKIPLRGSRHGFAATSNFLEEWPRYADLARFERDFAPWTNRSFTLSSFNGGLLDQNSTNSATEANLDMQYMVGLSSAPVHAYYLGGRGPDLTDVSPNRNEPYLEFLSYLLALPENQLPHTLSTSYSDFEDTLPRSYEVKVCQMFGQLGARGVSILFPSGDYGVGLNCSTNGTVRLRPEFPSSCPWVTTVGGTTGIPEMAALQAGGGFSEVFARPKYQDAAVKPYLAKYGTRFAGHYNASGRGYPDVSAQYYHYAIVDRNITTVISGTSASTPAFAAVISLLNGGLLEAGRRPLGFLNPWLYGIGHKALNDVTAGHSIGCYPDLENYGEGWSADVGWDPVTGYGTPDFEKLQALVFSRGRMD